jgi:surface antigen
MRPASTANKAVAALLACLAAGAAPAMNLQVPKDTPLAQFDDEDVRMLKAALEQALEAPDLGRSVEWKNERTGSGGTVVPSESGRAGCRKLAIQNSHKATSRRSNVQFCKVDGAWKLTG